MISQGNTEDEKAKLRMVQSENLQKFAVSFDQEKKNKSLAGEIQMFASITCSIQDLPCKLPD